MKTFWRVSLCGALALSVLVVGKRVASAIAGDEKSIRVDGQERTYLLHVPRTIKKDVAVPLVFVFHGGGGQGRSAELLYGFNKIADREGFIVVYPNGLQRQWRDGRTDAVSRRPNETVDDLRFVTELLDSISKTYTIDPRRVFATGMSNGAMFSNYVGANLSDKFAAIAPVAGSLAKEFAPKFHPSNPISVLLIHGLDDPLVPYNGGPINIGQQGSVLGVPKTINLWVKHNQCSSTTTKGNVKNIDLSDGCEASWTKWSEGGKGTEVVLYSIKGGGHSWPTTGKNLRKRTNGQVCHDFDASETIWEFFKAHPKQ